MEYSPPYHMASWDLIGPSQPPSKGKTSQQETPIQHSNIAHITLLHETTTYASFLPSHKDLQQKPFLHGLSQTRIY